ncbi:MAG TPA: serine hydrolase [Polyangiaceae bacterium]|nr:serine hydrolase [Polyangiaceae bacterium]
MKLLPRTVLGRAVAVVFAVLLAASLAATRFWSSRNSFRQMRLFAPSVRVQNFRTMDELFPAKLVHHGTTPHHFARRALALPRTYVFGGSTHAVDEFLERSVTTALLVLKDDDLVSERYFLGASADSPLTSWSVAKSVVSVLTGIARDEGRIGALSTPLGALSPKLAGSDYGEVSLHDALTMSSGIAFSEEYDDARSDIHTMFARVFYFGESVPHYLATRSREVAPGTRFHYASSDTLALGLALRDAVGTSLAEYLEEKLWKPLGMEYDATWNAEGDTGMELAFCCLNVRARDFAKIGRLMARGGDWDGKRVVSEAWVRESTRAEAPRTPGRLPRHPWGYQYQWWVPGPPGVFMAAGVWGQFIYVDSVRQVVIVKTSVDPDFDRNGDENVALFETIAASL